MGDSLSRVILNQKEIHRIDSVDKLIGKYFKESLYSYIVRKKYDLLLVEIIRQLTQDYNYKWFSYFEVDIPYNLEKEYNMLISRYSKGQDSRNIGERIIFLGVSWVLEDLIVDCSSGVFILTGCDRERNLLNDSVTNSPDLRYIGKGESFYVEICSDFTGFMQRNHRYDVRKIKYLKLEDIVVIEKQRVLMLFLDVANQKYYSEWFTRKPYSEIDKYFVNSVTFEINPNIEFKSFMYLFDYCKTLQSNPSLFSNFLDNSTKSVKSQVYSDYENYKDDGYWESLYLEEPQYIRCRIPDIESEVFGNHKEYKDDLNLGIDYSCVDFESNLRKNENMGILSEKDEEEHRSYLESLEEEMIGDLPF